jgi:hypothetical protein
MTEPAILARVRLKLRVGRFLLAPMRGPADAGTLVTWRRSGS